MKKLLALCLVAILAMTCFVGCGQTGTYKLDSIEVAGQSYSISSDEVKQMGLTADAMTIELKSGGKAVLTANGEKTDAEYKISGSTITLSADGDSYDATIDGGKITIEYSGVKMVLKK